MQFNKKTVKESDSKSFHGLVNHKLGSASLEVTDFLQANLNALTEAEEKITELEDALKKATKPTK